MRITEALLLSLALLTLWIGTALVLTAKSIGNPASPPLIPLNRATAKLISAALDVDDSVAARIVSARIRHHGFEDVDAIGHIPIVENPRAADAGLKAAGIPTPQSRDGDTAHVKAILGLDSPAAARLQAIRDAYPKVARWDRLLASPLMPTGKLNSQSHLFCVRTWSAAVRLLINYDLLLTAFFIGMHLTIRRTRPRADPFLLPIAAILSFLGVLVLFALKDPIRDMPAYAAQVQGIVIGGGFGILLSLSGWLNRAPLHRYGYLYALAAVFCTIVLGIAGSGPGGVRLEVAGAQPIEIIKILLVFFIAAYLAERAPVLIDPLRRWGPFPVPRKADVLPLVVLYALPLALFALVRDLGPVLLLFGTFLVMLYLATGRAIFVAVGIVALGAGAVVGNLLHFGVFHVRVDMWMSPWANSHKGGDQTALGLWGIASGGPMGSGLGLGGTKFIPRGGSDLAFASLSEETGLIGGALTIFCLLALVARGLRIAQRAATDFDRYLAAGLSVILALQAAIIISGVLSLTPLAGITLPFVSYGKSSLIVSFFSIGMLLALSARPETATASGRSVPPEFRRAASRLGPVAALFFIGCLLTRLIWVQYFAADGIASRVVRVPDADGVVRPHVNPRLMQMASHIGRGRILDRNGKVLAETVDGNREYPLGANTAQMIGYLDPSVGGPTGMEAHFDPMLRGFDGYANLVPLWRRKDIPGFRLPTGGDITLSLDSQLQIAAVNALTEGAASVRDRRTGKPLDRGAAVVLDTATGGVLASVTLPTFDPAKLTASSLHTLNGNGEFALINRAVSGYYPPGSTFKIVTAASLLTQGKSSLTVVCKHIDENIYWHANGVTYARRRIADDETDQPHGTIGMTDAIAQSCNVYFAHAGLTLGPEALRQTAAQFGFSRLPSAYDFGANLPDIGYGQGPMLVTPMEMAGVAQTVANSGVRLRPSYRLNSPRTLVGTPMRAADAAQIASAMVRVTQSGTAAGRFADLPFSVAGKTGTAQNNAGDRVAHSWFIGFAPADHPRIAIAVLVENGGYGAAVAVPIAHKILRAALAK